MLKYFVAIGRWLHRFRGLLVTGIVVGIGLFAASVFGSNTGHSELGTMLPVLLVSWCLVGMLFAQGFHMGVPEVPSEGKWRERTVVRLKRGLFSLLGLVLLILAAGSALLTVRALGFIIR